MGTFMGWTMDVNCDVRAWDYCKLKSTVYVDLCLFCFVVKFCLNLFHFCISLICLLLSFLLLPLKIIGNVFMTWENMFLFSAFNCQFVSWYCVSFLVPLISFSKNKNSTFKCQNLTISTWFNISFACVLKFRRNMNKKKERIYSELNSITKQCNIRILDHMENVLLRK